MGVEIERKFLVAADPPSGAARGEAVPLRQAYVALEGDRAVRVRRAGDRARLTIKAGGGMARTEVELDLDAAVFEELWAISASRSVVKHRTRIPLADGLVAELDDFGGRHEGLRLVEVEFPSTEAATAFAAPDWFGSDVTDEVWASNAWLATHELVDVPAWVHQSHAEQ